MYRARASNSGTGLSAGFAWRIAVAVDLSIDAPRRPISPNGPPQMPPRLAGCSGTPGTILAQKNPLLCGFRVNLGASWDGLKLVYGAGTRVRTGDLPLTRRLLYQLSYAGSLRSEEHTSELQSLMRISYAVICLK